MNKCLNKQDVEIVAFHLMPQNGSRIKAFADIRLGDFTIREFRILADWKDDVRVVPPRVSWKGTDGNLRFKTVVSLPQDIEERVSAIILEKYSEEQNEDQKRTASIPKP